MGHAVQIGGHGSRSGVPQDQFPHPDLRAVSVYLHGNVGVDGRAHVVGGVIRSVHRAVCRSPRVLQNGHIPGGRLHLAEAGEWLRRGIRHPGTIFDVVDEKGIGRCGRGARHKADTKNVICRVVGQPAFVLVSPPDAVGTLGVEVVLDGSVLLFADPDKGCAFAHEDAVMRKEKRHGRRLVDELVRSGRNALDNGHGLLGESPKPRGQQQLPEGGGIVALVHGNTPTFGAFLLLEDEDVIEERLYGHHFVQAPVSGPLQEGGIIAVEHHRGMPRRHIHIYRPSIETADQPVPPDTAYRSFLPVFGNVEVRHRPDTDLHIFGEGLIPGDLVPVEVIIEAAELLFEHVALALEGNKPGLGETACPVIHTGHVRPGIAVLPVIDVVDGSRSGGVRGLAHVHIEAHDRVQRGDVDGVRGSAFGYVYGSCPVGVVCAVALIVELGLDNIHQNPVPDMPKRLPSGVVNKGAGFGVAV